MTIHFGKAAKRHLRDCHSLLSQQRHANADQLAGLAAECGLKAILEVFGILTARADPPPKLKKHVNELWDEFFAQISGRRAITVGTFLPRQNPFANWDVAQRYDDVGCDHRPTVHDHAQIAGSIMSLLQEIKTQGDTP